MLRAPSATRRRLKEPLTITDSELDQGLELLTGASTTGSQLHFSLSRRADLVLIGMTSTPIGVDVETLASSEIIAEVGPLLHAAERAEMRAAAPSRRAHVFTSIWTRKEAYRKGIGVGITADLAADYLGADRQAATPRGWTVITVPVAPGYAAAAAIRRPAP